MARSATGATLAMVTQLLLSTSPLSAQAPATPKVSAQELSFEEVEYEKGLTFYKAGDYKRAVAAFIKVYRRAPTSNLIYNIARCYEELKRFNKAADSYEAYLKLSPQAPDKAQVLVTIKTLRSLGQPEQVKGDQTPVAQAKTTPTDKTEQPERSEQASADQDTQGPVGGVAPSAEQGDQGGAQVWAWTSVGLGGALLAGGIWSTIEAGDAYDQRKGAKSKLAYNTAQSDMTSAALRADLFLVGGVALVTTGVVMMLLTDEGSDESDQDAQLSLSPNHISVRWRF